MLGKRLGSLLSVPHRRGDEPPPASCEQLPQNLTHDEDLIVFANADEKEYKIRFTDDFLYMNLSGWEERVKKSKISGIKHFVWGAVSGSLYTMFLTLILSFPLGVATAAYLEEFAPKNIWMDIIYSFHALNALTRPLVDESWDVTVLSSFNS